ncbi:MAG: hypothetical protein HYV07_13805 [Deltaproteobacteria bacterium]|nr:hypothetical protein [Deltaproteobacteria bacterium]
MKGSIVAVACAGFFGCASSKSAETAGAPGGTAGAMVKCGGVNECKGTGKCGGADHDCAGKNECKGKGVMEMSAEDCTAKGGTAM